MRYRLKEDQRSYVKNLYAKVEEKLSAECDRMEDIIPYIPANGLYTDMGAQSINWWTNGFWAGILWQLYHATQQIKYKRTAIRIEHRLEDAFSNFDQLDHDVGFLWLHTSVANHRMTGDMEARRKGLLAASVLVSRFNLKGGFLRAWNPPAACSMIIDCLMNLPILYWASEQTKDPRYSMIAGQHIDSALKYLIRPDGSCNHIAEMDALTGEFIDNPGGQGYEKGSSWSRGQAWAIYGMALAYGYNNKEEYLDAAKKVAHYFIANAAMTDYVSLIDFRSPAEPVYYDTTATACAACGLLELANHVKEYEKDLYIQSAFRMLEGMEHSFLDLNLSRDGILLHGSARYHRESDREVPIIYGDYFLLELLLRFQDKDFLIW